MRHILITAAALAVGGFFASSPASAQQGAPGYTAGGPQQVAGWCKMATDDNGDMDNYGYHVPCGGQALASEPRRSRRHR
jgi:hypothetical protein